MACPCSFGQTNPIAFMVDTGVGARIGIFNKDGELLEITQKVKTVVFDKTGTITEGDTRVIKVYAMLLLSSLSLNLVRAIAGSVKSNSERPNGKWTTNFDLILGQIQQQQNQAAPPQIFPFMAHNFAFAPP